MLLCLTLVESKQVLLFSKDVEGQERLGESEIKRIHTSTQHQITLTPASSAPGGSTSLVGPWDASELPTVTELGRVPPARLTECLLGPDTVRGNEETCTLSGTDSGDKMHPLRVSLPPQLCLLLLSSRKMFIGSQEAQPHPEVPLPVQFHGTGTASP